MNKIKDNPFKYLKIFSIIYLALSVIFKIISGISQSIQYDIPCDFIYVILEIVCYIPFGLFLVYIIKFYSKNKHHILLTVSYALSSVLGIISLFCAIFNTFEIYDEFTPALVISLLSYVVNIGIAIYYTYDCFSKFKHLKISQIISIIKMFGSIVPVITSIILVSSVGLLTFLLNLTGLLCSFVYYVFWKYGVTVSSDKLAENALYEIKEKFDNGIISEEEYNQKKAEILGIM